MYLAIIILLSGNPSNPSFSDEYTSFLAVSSHEVCMEIATNVMSQLIANPQTPYWHGAVNCHAIENIRIIE
jgi:hypothetical protein